jgi:hypothetical protein
MIRPEKATPPSTLKTTESRLKSQSLMCQEVLTVQLTKVDYPKP